MDAGKLPPFFPQSTDVKVPSEEPFVPTTRPHFQQLSEFSTAPSLSPKTLRSRKVIDETQNEDPNDARDTLEDVMLSIMSHSPNEKNKKRLLALEEELKNWKDKFTNEMDFIKDLHRHQGTVYELLKYLQTNKETLLILFKSTLSINDYELVVTFLDEEYTSIRLFEPALAVILGPITLFMIRKFDHQLKEIAANYKPLLENSPPHQRKINILENLLSKEHDSILKYSGFKLSELMSYHLLPIFMISYWQNQLEYKQIIKICRLAFTTLKKISSTFKLFAARENRKNLEIKLKTTLTVQIQFTPQFKNYVDKKAIKDVHDDILELAREYQAETAEKAYAEQITFNEVLKSREIEFNAKTVMLIKELDALIEAYPEESQFNQFEDELEKKGFYFKNIEDIPNSLQEWRSKDENFTAWKRKLCQQTVEHHLTIGRLLKNGNTCSISTKCKLEGLFVNFNIAKNIIDIVSNILQIFLLLPQKCIGSFRDYLSTIEKKLAIPGVELSFIFYPDINLSIEGLASSIVGHFFGYYFKPNEYSLMGYWIDLQKKWNGFIYNFQYALHILMKFCFQVFDKILHFIMRTKNDPSIEPRTYTKINKYLAANRQAYKEVMDKLESEMNKLKLKDVKNLLNGQTKDWNGWDNLQSIIQGLTEGNYQLFSDDVLDHFKYEAGIELNDMSKLIVPKKIEVKEGDEVEEGSIDKDLNVEEKSQIQMEIEELYTRSMKDFFRDLIEREDLEEV